MAPSLGCLLSPVGEMTPSLGCPLSPVGEMTLSLGLGRFLSGLRRKPKKLPESEKQLK